MARRKTIKIRGVKGKKFTKYPFFARNEQEKKAVTYSKLIFRRKQRKRFEGIA